MTRAHTDQHKGDIPSEDLYQVLQEGLLYLEYFITLLYLKSTAACMCSLVDMTYWLLI